MQSVKSYQLLLINKFVCKVIEHPDLTITSGAKNDATCEKVNNYCKAKSVQQDRINQEQQFILLSSVANAQCFNLFQNLSVLKI